MNTSQHPHFTSSVAVVCLGLANLTGIYGMYRMRQVISGQSADIALASHYIQVLQATYLTQALRLQECQSNQRQQQQQQQQQRPETRIAPTLGQ